MLEIDVAGTKDGAPVLMHDATVNRTTDGAGDIAALALEELHQLRLHAGEPADTPCRRQGEAGCGLGREWRPREDSNL